ncbi:MAG: hypothetical protein ACETWQ_11770 [Phycisphaerae bacterium]
MEIIFSDFEFNIIEQFAIQLIGGTFGLALLEVCPECLTVPGTELLLTGLAGLSFKLYNVPDN